MRFTRIGAIAALLAATVAPAAHATPADDTAAYLKRIEALDANGPRINAVIALNPDAMRQAKAAEGKAGPLAGKAILVKDNIETADPMPTTAGSLALANNVTGRDAPMIARLRKAGVVILGKTNLSEWANFRSTHSISGWSGVGGLTRNPHATDRSACGSSAGSGAAVAAGFAWAAIGTETDGSITCPASLNGVVGFKPTVGLVSRTHIVPISHSQDTAGPMAATVRDAALMLTAMAGSDPADAATKDADAHKADFAAGLDGASLKGVRIGVIRRKSRANPLLYDVYDKALADLTRAGAVLVDIDYTNNDAIDRDEFTVLLYELREDLNAYLAGLPGHPPVRSLADLIAFDKANAAAEMPWFGQELFEMAEKATDKAAYEKARENAQRLAGPEGIDRLLAENRVAFLVAPTTAPAWPIDFVNGGHYTSVGAGTLAAVAGYPHLTVPMGDVHGLPIGLSFIGAKWDDAHILQAGAVYERVRSATIAAPTFRRWEP
ncbi:amidase [Novosphingobium sp. ZN18A2]|uniref:amidase n=1 Tax=Novosphingobium sp. ZN18A2 TaxID=3079861 RepID=UPI0030CECFDF